MKKQLIFIVSILISGHCLAESPDWHTKRLQKEAAAANTTIITQVMTPTAKASFIDDNIDSENHKVAVVFSPALKRRELKNWLKEHDVTLLNAAIANGPSAPVLARIRGAYIFGDTIPKQLDFIEQKFKLTLEEFFGPVGNEDGGDYEDEPIRMRMHFPRIDVIAKKSSVTSVSEQFEGIAALSILGRAEEMSPVIQDTSAYLVNDDPAIATGESLALSEEEIPDMLSPPDIAGITPLVVAKMCGSGTPEARCPPDKTWSPHIKGSYTSFYVNIKTHDTNDDWLVGESRNFIKWSATELFYGLPYNVWSWTEPRAKRCYPISDSNFTKKCRDNKDDVWIAKGTYESELSWIDRGCTADWRTGYPVDAYRGCMYMYWGASLLPGWYEDDLATDPGHTFSPAMGGLDMDTIIPGRTYSTSMHFHAKTRTYNRTGDIVTMRGQVGVDSYIGPYAIDTRNLKKKPLIVRYDY